jgi:hypothetical protein
MFMSLTKYILNLMAKETRKRKAARCAEQLVLRNDNKSLWSILQDSGLKIPIRTWKAGKQDGS